MISRNIMPPIIENFLETPLGLFLDSHRVTEKGDVSFTGMGTVKGKFYVKDEEYTYFLDLLHDYLFEQNKRPLNLVEQRRNDLLTPILIDLDFKYSSNQAIQRQFELPHIHTFVRNYVENLTNFYQLEDLKQLRFFITLRPAPYEDKKVNTLNRSIKDGIHIQCPDIILNSEHQQVLRHRSIELCNLTNAFKNTGYINTEKDIFDEAIVKKNGWFFYGESKPDIPAYNLISVYVYDTITHTFSEDDTHNYTNRQLLELLSIRHNLNTTSIPFNQDIHDEWKERLDYCTGKRLTINNVIDEHQSQDFMVVTTTSSNIYEQFERDKIVTSKLLATQCLSTDRASGYQSWIEVGWCLHNIDTSEDMFNAWMEFSNKSPNHIQP